MPRTRRSRRAPAAPPATVRATAPWRANLPRLLSFSPFPFLALQEVVEILLEQRVTHSARRQRLRLAAVRDVDARRCVHVLGVPERDVPVDGRVELRTFGGLDLPHLFHVRGRERRSNRQVHLP